MAVIKADFGIGLILIFTCVKAIIIGAISCFLISPVVENDWATVSRNMDVGIYVLSVPVRDFDTVCTFKTKRNFLSYPGPSTPNTIIGFGKAVELITVKAVKRSKRKEDVDAIISFDGQHGTAVKFTSKVSDGYVNRAKVNRYKEYMVFAMNKPVNPHHVIAHVELNKKLPLDNVVDFTMPVLLDSLIARYEKLNVQGKADGMITQDGTSADFIVFKK